jgi:hypothetical protein
MDLLMTLKGLRIDVFRKDTQLESSFSNVPEN